MSTRAAPQLRLLPSPASRDRPLPSTRSQERLRVLCLALLELAIFGSLAVAYVLYRVQFAAAFEAGSRKLPLLWGTVGTGLLLSSSFCMALAVRAAQLARRTERLLWIAGAALLGLLYLGTLLLTGLTLAQDHLWPGASFKGDVPSQIFFTLFATVCLVYAFHLFIGLQLLIWSGHESRLPQSRTRLQRLEMIALYWHSTCLLWIFIFPAFFLIRGGA